MRHLMVIFTAKSVFSRLNMFLCMLHCSLIFLFTGRAVWFGELTNSPKDSPINTKDIDCKVYEVDDTDKIHEFSN